MKTKTRLYLPDRLHDATLTLIGEEAHYLVQVLHSEVGDGVLVFGMESTESLFRIEKIEPGQVHLERLEIRQVETESPVDLTLVVAVGKGKKLEEIVEATTALGIKRVIPFVGRHSVAKKSNPRLQERLQIIAKEACRQSRRTQPPEIDPVHPKLERALDSLGPKQGTWVLFDEAGGESLSEIVCGSDASAPWVMFCGPEGGWSPKERELFDQAGCRRASLGPRILRTELAAVVAVGILENLLSQPPKG
ncbi:MAG: 16S rRNA (uracil(1498)-N(3))-methyltransferase [Candidatus Omnitrophica bacterium]|nr:16S rRNA (uracil(1498)-N(3))-methyltransferase [Candidatus Omnitrophota bacterium]